MLPDTTSLAQTYDALTVMTLTLNAGAVKLIVLPVEIVLVLGTAVLGDVGVLAAVWAPVRSCRDPEVATLLNGSWKVRSSLAAAALAICK